MGTPDSNGFLYGKLIGPSHKPRPTVTRMGCMRRGINFRTVSTTSNGFEVAGHFCFAGLGGCRVRCDMLSGGGAVGDKGISLSVTPRTSGRFAMPMGNLGSRPKARCFMGFDIAAMRPRPLVPTNCRVTCSRFRLPVRTRGEVCGTGNPTLAATASNSRLAMSSSGMGFMFGGGDKLIASCGISKARCFGSNFNVRPGF